MKKNILWDTSIKNQGKLQKKLEFLDSNQALIEDKMEIIKKHEEEKYNERINYFPFTHGDAIEK